MNHVKILSSFLIAQEASLGGWITQLGGWRAGPEASLSHHAALPQWGWLYLLEFFYN
jgi:hypothetical protein